MMRRAAAVPILALLGAVAWPGPFVSTQTPIGQTARDATAGPPPQGTGTIGGTLVAADTGRPVRYARVTLTGVDTRLGRTTSTDAQGRFAIPGLNAGLYTLTASKGGMLEVIFGQKRPGSGRPGTPIQLNANQKIENVSLKMARGGVIGGTVIDELGEPMFGVSVRALRFVLRNGIRTPSPAGNGQTDDRGMYRIAGLLPGEYIVMAMPSASAEMQIAEVEMMKAKAEAIAMEAAAAQRASLPQAADTAKFLMDQQRELTDRIAMMNATGDPTDAYVPSFHPGSSNASTATTITLDISEERSAVDMQVLRQPIGRISGTLSIVDGALPPNTTVQLFDATQTQPMLTRAATRAGPDGRFSFVPVPPGQYTIVATASIRSGEPAPAPPAPSVTYEKALEERLRAVSASTPYWAMTEISTNGQPITGVSLTLQRGMTISGQVVVSDSPVPVDMKRLTLTVTSVNAPIPIELPSPPPAVVDPQGRFTIKGVMPGTYRVVPSSGLPGLTVKSSVFDGRDTLDFPLVVKPGDDVAGGVVTLTPRAAEVSGRLQESTGWATSDFTIVLFPSDQRFWTPGSRRIQAGRPSTDGRFSFRSLPAGEYRLVAVTDIETGQWFDPAFLRPLMGASIGITLGEGEQRVQDIRIR